MSLVTIDEDILYNELMYIYVSFTKTIWDKSLETHPKDSSYITLIEKILSNDKILESTNKFMYELLQTEYKMEYYPGLVTETRGSYMLDSDIRDASWSNPLIFIRVLPVLPEVLVDFDIEGIILSNINAKITKYVIVLTTDNTLVTDIVSAYLISIAAFVLLEITDDSKEMVSGLFSRILIDHLARHGDGKDNLTDTMLDSVLNKDSVVVDEYNYIIVFALWLIAKYSDKYDGELNDSGFNIQVFRDIDLVKASVDDNDLSLVTDMMMNLFNVGTYDKDYIAIDNDTFDDYIVRLETAIDNFI